MHASSSRVGSTRDCYWHIVKSCSELTVKIGQYSTNGVSLSRLGVVPLVTGRI